MNDRVTGPLQKLEDICAEIYGQWDKDLRPGKLLAALSGTMPGYRQDVTDVREALASLASLPQGAMGEDDIARIIDPDAFVDAALQDDFTPSERAHFSAQREKDKERAHEKARAILSRLSVPDGWKVMPIEPTEEMRFAVWFDQFKTCGGSDDEAKALADRKVADKNQRAQDISSYRAMVTASPSPSKAGEG